MSPCRLGPTCCVYVYVRIFQSSINISSSCWYILYRVALIYIYTPSVSEYLILYDLSFVSKYLTFSLSYTPFFFFHFLYIFPDTSLFLFLSTPSCFLCTLFLNLCVQSQNVQYFGGGGRIGSTPILAWLRFFATLCTPVTNSFGIRKIKMVLLITTVYIELHQIKKRPQFCVIVYSFAN